MASDNKRGADGHIKLGWVPVVLLVVAALWSRPISLLGSEAGPVVHGQEHSVLSERYSG
jgi:hypothetical protein